MEIGSLQTAAPTTASHLSYIYRNDFALTCAAVANCETWRGDVRAMVPCLEGGHFPSFLVVGSSLAGNRRFTISSTLVVNT
jgi:hypothetical protein